MLLAFVVLNLVSSVLSQ